MKRGKVFILACLVTVLLAGVALGAPAPSHRGVVAPGGGLSHLPSGHVLYATIGQPAIGVSRNDDQYYLIGGYHTFWQPRWTAVRHWSLY
jgi:hypothetical protein